MFDDLIDIRSLNVSIRVNPTSTFPLSQRYANAERLSSISFSEVTKVTREFLRRLF